MQVKSATPKQNVLFQQNAKPKPNVKPKNGYHKQNDQGILTEA